MSPTLLMDQNKEDWSLFLISLIKIEYVNKVKFVLILNKYID